MHTAHDVERPVRSSRAYPELVFRSALLQQKAETVEVSQSVERNGEHLFMPHRELSSLRMCMSAGDATRQSEGGRSEGVAEASSQCSHPCRPQRRLYWRTRGGSYR